MPDLRDGWRSGVEDIADRVDSLMGGVVTRGAACAIWCARSGAMDIPVSRLGDTALRFDVSSSTRQEGG